MKKSFILVISIILIALFAISFVSCKKKNTDNTDYTPISSDIAMTVVISEEVIETQQEIDQKGVYTKYEFENPTDITEGLLTLLDQKDIEYFNNGSMYTKIGNAELSTEEKASGNYRIIIYTTVAADQNTTDSAKKIKFGTYNLVQTNKAPEDLSIPTTGNNVILIAKVKIA